MSKYTSYSLSEICTEITDGSHFSPDLTSSGYPYITVRDIVEDSLNFSNCKYISAKDYDTLVRNGCRPQKGDVLFSKDGTVGKVALVESSKEFVVLSSLAILRPDQSRVFPPYLRYALKSPQVLKVAVDKKTGAAIRRIILRNLKSIEIPLPPLAEQKRIVALLDEAFAGIDKAQANAEAMQLNAKKLKTSVLFEQLNTQQAAAQTRWNVAKLGEISELLADGDWIESKDQSDEGIRLIQTGNIGDGFFKNRAEKARYISEETFKRLRCTEIFKGDCLVSRLPEPVGRSCILPAIPRSITAVDCCIIRFKRSYILPEFFCYFSQSKDYQDAVESKTSGTTRKRISRSHLSEIEVPLPPLAEQNRIVALLDEAFSYIEGLDSDIASKFSKLSELKASLLAQVFEGDVGV